MKRLNCLLSLLLVTVMLLTSCGALGDAFGNDPLDRKPDFNNGDGNGDNFDDPNGNNNGNVTRPGVSPFPGDSLMLDVKQGVIGSIVQTGDGTATVTGTVPAPRSRAVSTANDENRHLVTLEHSFGYDCYVSGYMGNSLYVIQDFGSLAWNKKGIGHKDGTVLLDYNSGYFSISALNENKVIVGHPTDEAAISLWEPTDSYLFGYMVYDPEAMTLTPLYEENNLRFYTAGYFINGAAQVSVKEGDKILFGVIDQQGNYIVEPQYEMMADESVNDIVIVAQTATPYQQDDPNMDDNCGRNIWYDSTLMTNVQNTRHYSSLSSTVGLLNVTTGETVLPCSYSYAERVIDSTYFIIDNEGNRFLYDATTGSFTDVEEGAYAYLNNEWMIYVDGNGDGYLADKSLELYEIDEDFTIGDLVGITHFNVHNRINDNIVSALREENAKAAGYPHGPSEEIRVKSSANDRYNDIIISATGEVITEVSSYTTPYNGSFLYTKENSLYRYDLNKQTSTIVETGYGNFTEDYNNHEENYHTSVYQLGVGVYVLRYNVTNSVGSTYLMVIVNDKGEVLFDACINSVENLTKNYLGKYDDALYELAGSTDIEDNYFLTRDDGSHFLIQFVRGEAEDSGIAGEAERRYIRRLDNFSTFSYLSPFMLEFSDGSEITVLINGNEVPSEFYVYDSEAQSIKFLTRVFDYDNTLYDTLHNEGFFEILVTSGGESIVLVIEVSPFAFRF